MDGGFAAKRAVEGYSKTVGLITNSLKHLKRLGITIQEQRIRISYPYYLFKTLGKTYHCKSVLDTEFAKGLISKIKLSLTTVYHHELRKILRRFLQHARIAAVHDLLHGGIVIGTDDSLYLEFAVVFL